MEGRLWLVEEQKGSWQPLQEAAEVDQSIASFLQTGKLHLATRLEDVVLRKLQHLQHFLQTIKCCSHPSTLVCLPLISAATMVTKQNEAEAGTHWRG